MRVINTGFLFPSLQCLPERIPRQVMAEPARKRKRTAPCPCPACSGRIRDKRTIEVHTERMYHAYMNVISATYPGSAGDRTPPEFTVVPDLDTCNLEEQTINHDSPALDVPEERIRRFVMKEVK